MTGLICRKIGMSSYFDEDGEKIPCTIVFSDKNTVLQIKNKEKDNYNSVLLGFGTVKKKNASKSLFGICKKANTDTKEYYCEIKGFEQDFNIGDSITITDIFQKGDNVDVIGTSKGKGFQGVVKRHGFSGVGGQTHGQHNRMRHPGSVGASSFPSRVFKGLRMAGRMGGRRVTTQNVSILEICKDENLIILKGCIPGYNGNIVILKKK